MHAARLTSRLLSPVLAVALLLSVASPAQAARPSASRPRLRGTAARKARLVPPPLSAQLVTSGIEGTVTITGGASPFTVVMRTPDGEPTRLYRGSSRSVAVALPPVYTKFEVASMGVTITAGAIGDVDVWAVDGEARRLQCFNTALEATITDVPLAGGEDTATTRLRGVAVRPLDRHPFVVVSGEGSGAFTENRLVELDASGTVVATHAVPGSYKIQDAAFDASGRMYVVDRGTGLGNANRVRVVKLDVDGTYLDATATVLPDNGLLYPMSNLTTMIEYQPSADRLVARINSSTFAIIDPATLAIQSYRYSADPAYTCIAVDFAGDALYTGGSGFQRPPFFGKQAGFMTDPRYADVSIVATTAPIHAWEVTPTLPAITDVAVDANGFVYTIQRDFELGVCRAYIVDGAGSQVGVVDLPYGTKVAVSPR